MRARLAAFLLTGIAAAGPAQAGVVTVSFGGVFDTAAAGCSPFSSQPGNCATTAIATPFSGSFSYSTAAPGSLTDASMTSDAFASLGLATTLTGVNGPNAYAQQSGGTITFGNMLGSLFSSDLATLKLTYPGAVGASLSAPLPPLSSALGGTFGFVTSASPGGTGPSLSGTLSYFTAATAAVPEAATWATMLCGVAMAGAALRRRRRAPAYA